MRKEDSSLPVAVRLIVAVFVVFAFVTVGTMISDAREGSFEFAPHLTRAELASTSSKMLEEIELYRDKVFDRLELDNQNEDERLQELRLRQREHVLVIKNLVEQLSAIDRLSSEELPYQVAFQGARDSVRMLKEKAYYRGPGFASSSVFNEDVITIFLGMLAMGFIVVMIRR